MKPKAVADLGNRSDREFFSKVAEGMKLCILNATSFFRDVRRLALFERNRSAGVLTAFAHEEVAKYLILLDAVRCPRKRRYGHLERFNDHLAKGLYVLLYNRYPNTLADVRRWADEARAKFYLDGPNDVDWIFYNEVLDQRERSIYVDFVVTDEGAYWRRPHTRLPFIPGFGVGKPQGAHLVALCLHAAGFSSPEALKTVANIWREKVFDDTREWDDLRALNRETLCQLDSRGLLLRQSAAIIAPIVNNWLFPLYDVTLSYDRNSKDEDIKNELRERRKKWSPPDQ